MKYLFVLLSALTICGLASAQKISLVPDSFLKDVNSLAGVSRIGNALLAADPDKLKWGDYCKQSQALSRRGEFREAIRSASKALYMGENKDGNYGATVIFSSNDIATAYSYAGDHVTALIWADRTLGTISKGFEGWARPDILLITANVRRIKALAYSNAGRHQDAAAELIKGIDSLPSNAGAFRSELAIALASVSPRVTIVVASLEPRTLGAAMKEISGTLRTIIQGPGSSSAVAA